jgi:DNA-binding CsgD family transcriptional regulator/PAS domain-containing protein
MTCSRRTLTEAAVAAVYDAAEDEARWPDALGAMARVSGALCGVVYALDANRIVGWRSVYAVDPAGLNKYSGDFAATDAKLAVAVARPNELMVEGVTSERPRWYDGSDHDREIYAAQGCKYTMGMVVKGSDIGSWVIAHHAERGRGMFTTEDVRWYSEVMKHATRALRLDVLRRRELTRTGSLAAALDQLSTAIILVSRDGRVIDANASAKDILDSRSGLRLVAGRLWPDDAGARQALMRAIAACGVRAGPDDLPFGGTTLPVPRAADRPIFMQIVPLDLGSSLAHPTAATCMIVITDPNAQTPRGASAIARSLGLTPAESRIAALLAEGLSTSEIAEREGRKVETVRTYVKRVMGRMGVNRQSEVVRILSTQPRYDGTRNPSTEEHLRRRLACRERDQD